MSNNRSNDAWASELATKIPAVLSAPPFAADVAITVADREFASLIDHTLLKPDATPAQIDTLCDEAVKYKFKSCCINGANVSQVSTRLLGSGVIPCSVVGFPLGAAHHYVKAFETSQAISDGAKEIDMVVNIGALKSRNYDLVYNDIHAVVQAAKGIPVKVILETALLTDDEKVAGSYIAAEAGAAFIKTCTGFGGGAVTASDVSLMRNAVAYKGTVKVKASAGVRTFEKCLEVIRAGAERIGTSSGTAIIEGARHILG